MDKIFSARLDEAVLAEMDHVTHQHHMTKKKFLEEAIRRLAESMAQKDVWAETRGAWKRKESAAAIVKEIKSSWQKNYSRHHRP